MIGGALTLLCNVLIYSNRVPSHFLHTEAEQSFCINTASFRLGPTHAINIVPSDHPVLMRCELLAQADKSMGC